jgi:hypothetical protein
MYKQPSYVSGSPSHYRIEDSVLFVFMSLALKILPGTEQALTEEGRELGSERSTSFSDE